MSNFTTFFPSAGGGGGEGSGINSYAPFKVGTTDNNPQGYIHSTGLYTNPVDSSVWLKTGSTALDTTNTYPNAYSVLAHHLTDGSNTYGQGLRAALTYTGTGFYALRQINSSTRFIPADEATRTWGSEINKQSSQVSGSIGCYAIAYDSTANGILAHDWASGVDIIRRWNTALTTSTTFSTFAQTANSQPRCLAYDEANNNLFWIKSNGVVFIYDLTTETYSSTFTMSIGTTDIQGASVHPTTGNLWIVGTTTVHEVNPTTGANIATRFNLYANSYVTNGLVRGIAWKDADTLYAITEKVGNSGSNWIISSYDKDGINTVGDATAKTDSSGSAQPLFIKLK
jgi:hypothetical protein|tara:strand:- start:1127 stop:2149 length:1023 start_codon:yes stop_codon:yes gene_type:complete